MWKLKFAAKRITAIAAKINPSKMSIPVTPRKNSNLTFVFIGIILTILFPLEIMILQITPKIQII